MLASCWTEKVNERNAGKGTSERREERERAKRKNEERTELERNASDRDGRNVSERDGRNSSDQNGRMRDERNGKGTRQFGREERERARWEKRERSLRKNTGRTEWERNASDGTEGTRTSRTDVTKIRAIGTGGKRTSRTEERGLDGTEQNRMERCVVQRDGKAWNGASGFSRHGDRGGSYTLNRSVRTGGNSPRPFAYVTRGDVETPPLNFLFQELFLTADCLKHPHIVVMTAEENTVQ